MLPIRLPEADLTLLRQQVEAGNQIKVDLTTNSIKSGSANVSFKLEESTKHLLLAGLDDIAVTLKKSELIDTYETFMGAKFPWLCGDRQGSAKKVGEEPDVNIKPSKVEW